MPKSSKFTIISLIIILFLSLSILLTTNLNPTNQNRISYSELKSHMQNDTIKSIFIKDNLTLLITLKDGSVFQTPNPNNDEFKKELINNDIYFYDKSKYNNIQIISGIFIIISSILLLYILSKKSNSNNDLSLNNSLNDFSKNISHNFNSIAGNEEVKESLKDIVDFIKNPDKYLKYGARMPKGIILYGPPGTGKTLIAKSIAGEANIPFYALSGSDFVQMYVGIGARRIRDLFTKARSHEKCVIFIDEIDAIGKKRSMSLNSSDERDQTLNALLTEMSGFNEKLGIIVIGATNRLDILDDALLREGRFDRHIEVPLPDISARENIISLYIKNKPTKDINIKEIAKNTINFSGAKLENLINEASILAAKENSNFITNIHIDKAFSIILAGYDKINTKFMTKKDKKITAYHEAGHALASKLINKDDLISKVTIIPTSKGAGGYTLTLPSNNSAYLTAEKIENKIITLFGGRAAEEIIFGKDKITTGAQNDLKEITKLITLMILEYGMSKDYSSINLSTLKDLNINLDKNILIEIKEKSNLLYQKTKILLTSNKHYLDKIANLLLEKEVLNNEDLDSIIIKQ